MLIDKSLLIVFLQYGFVCFVVETQIIGIGSARDRIFSHSQSTLVFVMFSSLTNSIVLLTV